MAETRGITLNNPCNIKSSPNFTWQGEIKPTADPEKVLCQFDDMIDGVRAATKLLYNYHIKDGVNTIRQLVMRFAPPDPKGDNNPTEAYISNVCGWMGKTDDEPIDFMNADLMEDLIISITRQEQGHNCICDTDLQQGVSEGLA